MLECEVGVIAKLKQNESFLHMGNILDLKRKNQNELYEIHTHLYFLHSINITVKNEKYGEMTNECDITEIRTKFNLSGAIFLQNAKNVLDGVYETKSIELYDITCMQPVFDEKIFYLKKLHSEKKFEKKCVVVLFPYESSIKRGTLVESCDFLCENYDVSFVCIDNDKNKSGLLYKNYLVARGVREENIDIVSEGESILDDIISTLTMLDCFFPISSYIYVAIDYNDICKMSSFFRNFREKNKMRKLRYISNSSWKNFDK